MGAEVIDVGTLRPLDGETILRSVEKTGRCVIVHEAARTGGFGGEIAARLAEDGLLFLQAPVKRVTGYDTVMPLPPSRAALSAVHRAYPGRCPRGAGVRMSTFLLPDLGEGLAEAEIVSWHVSVADHVVTDQPLVAVETDKAVVEIPSPHSGRVTRLCAEVGARVQVDDPLVEFEAVGAQADTGTVVGEVDTGAAAAMPTPVAARSAVKATPAVRALARKRGVDISMLQSTGPDGAVTATDVERGAEALADAGPAEPLRGVRRAMADRMAKAHAEVVPATVTDVADVERWPAETVVMQRLIRAVVAGCAAAPALNAWFHGEERARRLRATIDLGIAVDIEDGLFVPVLRDVGRRAAEDIRDGLERLKRDVSTCTIPPARAPWADDHVVEFRDRRRTARSARCRAAASGDRRGGAVDAPGRRGG